MEEEKGSVVDRCGMREQWWNESRERRARAQGKGKRENEVVPISNKGYVYLLS